MTSRWEVTSWTDNAWLVTASEDKTLRLWHLNVDSLINQARRLAGRELTPEERKEYLLGTPEQVGQMD